MGTPAGELLELVKLVGGPGAVAALGWWLRGKFIAVEDATNAALKAHELQDERRHRQNLVRFAKLNMKLGIEDESESNGS